VSRIDLENQIAVAQSIAPAAARTATVTGTGVDLANTSQAVVVVSVGAITDGTHTLSIEESDSLGSGYSAVAAADLSETPGALVASTPVKIGYRGMKQYIRAKVTVTGSPGTGGFYDAVVVTRGARKQPV
jgi:hypothetical protein